MARLLITGGAGFIGSHTCVLLLEAGHDLVIVDSFINSSPLAIERVSKITGLDTNEKTKRLQVFNRDIRDLEGLKEVFNKVDQEGMPIEAVIHFAGLKSVRESVNSPLDYWDVNVNGSRCLLSAMEKNNCRTIVFSSSATLYGYPESIPIRETAQIKPINPYGQTKAAVEKMLADLVNMQRGWKVACLRYFNPVGAHPSGEIGEEPCGIPNNLFPFLSQIAVGRLPSLKVFGGDWPTPDGTGVRDYIHVMDLAEGHIAALNSLLNEEPRFLKLNLGSGKGHSVLELVGAFKKAIGKDIPFEIVDRRPGDVAITVADASQAKKAIGWQTNLSLSDICRDGWAWQCANPNGFGEKS